MFPNGSLIIEAANKVHDEGFYTCTAFNQRDESHVGTVQIEVLSKCFLLLLSHKCFFKRPPDLDSIHREAEKSNRKMFACSRNFLAVII